MNRISTHPGEILKEDVLPALGLNIGSAAENLGISRQMLSGILNGKRPMSAEMCLKVARLAGSTAEQWMRLQAMHDLSKAEMNKRTMQKVMKVPAMAHA